MQPLCARGVRGQRLLALHTSGGIRDPRGEQTLAG